MIVRFVQRHKKAPRGRHDHATDTSFLAEPLPRTGPRKEDSPIWRSDTGMT